MIVCWPRNTLRPWPRGFAYSDFVAETALKNKKTYFILFLLNNFAIHIFIFNRTWVKTFFSDKIWLNCSILGSRLKARPYFSDVLSQFFVCLTSADAQLAAAPKKWVRKSALKVCICMYIYYLHINIYIKVKITIFTLCLTSK